MAKIQNPTKVITGVNTRWSYANVWDAKSINGDAPKYSVSLIIPKSDTVTVSNILFFLWKECQLQNNLCIKGTSIHHILKWLDEIIELQ